MGLTPPFSGTTPPIPTSYQRWWCPDSQPDMPIWGTQSLTLDGIDSQSLTGAGSSVAGQLIRRLKVHGDCGSGRWWCALESGKGSAPISEVGGQNCSSPLGSGRNGFSSGDQSTNHSPPPVSKRDGNWQPSNLFYLASSVVLKVHISCQKFKI